MLGDISVLDKVYIVCGRTDMRKQIDGLCVIIEETVEELCRLAVRAQEYMKETGKTTLESMDLANIM